MHSLRDFIKQIWNRLPFAHKRMTVYWLVLLAGLIVMVVVVVTNNFPDSKKVITITMILFVINSLLFFTAPAESSKIKGVMLAFLTILLLGCLTFYLLSNGAVAI
ncbi:MAG TPA: hypothetical protein VMQ44_03170 [Candidatus Saccharimonadales bacterium]|nr:hypothetical protein [Candidatus Saccharimonadales bacterium]